jgi:hypothetical protein
MNISLTIFFVLAVVIAMALAMLGQEEIEGGEVFPWQFISSFVIGVCITHGEYFRSTYAWMQSYVGGDGIAGIALSAILGGVMEVSVASLPMLAGIALHYMKGAWRNHRVLPPTNAESERDI